MIRPLRRAHRFAVAALALAAPAVFVAGLAQRPPLVELEPASDRVTLAMPSGAEMVADARELFGAAVDRPDLLVYWTPDDPAPGALPVTARFAGSLESGRRGALQIPARGGYLVLYSLAHRQVVAKSPAPKEMP